MAASAMSDLSGCVCSGCSAPEGEALKTLIVPKETKKKASAGSPSQNKKPFFLSLISVAFLATRAISFGDRCSNRKMVFKKLMMFMCGNPCVRMDDGG